MAIVQVETVVRVERGMIGVIGHFDACADQRVALIHHAPWCNADHNHIVARTREIVAQNVANVLDHAGVCARSYYPNVRRVGHFDETALYGLFQFGLQAKVGYAAVHRDDQLGHL